MNTKTTRKLSILKDKDCNFFFYKTKGIYGLDCRQIRKKYFCLPFVIGFTYTVAWGYYAELQECGKGDLV